MAKHEFEVLVTVHGWSIPYRFTGELDLKEGASPILEALAEATRRAVRERDSYAEEPQPQADDREDVARYPKVAGKCPCCRMESLRLMEGGHVTCTYLGCGGPTATDNILHGSETPNEKQFRERAERAEARCASHARSIDFRDHLVTDLIDALKSGGEAPWWVTATHSLDALGKLAEGDVAASKG
jgi:hypothetical protein